jgi:hypothetical protein
MYYKVHARHSHARHAHIMHGCVGHGQVMHAHIIYLFIHNCLCVPGESMTPHPSFPPNLFFYVNLGTKGAQKLFKTLAPQLTVLGISHFCWCIKSHIASYRLIQSKANTQRIVVFGGQWNAPTSLKNCPSAKAYFLELLRLSSTPPPCL